MNTISAALESLPIGPEATFRNLTVVPLLRSSKGQPFYDTLDGALARNSVQITEVGEAGRVPEIRLLNTGERPVLVIEGEELVGAKQNRTLNLSILVPARGDVLAPVTCVEAGRWSARAGNFAASKRTHFAEGRAAKSRQVSDSLMQHGVPIADQQQVWDAIALKSARLSVASSTGAMAEIFTSHAAGVDDYVRAIPISENEVGAIVLIGGEPRGMDLFDSPATFKSLAPKILAGYAIDAIDRQRRDARWGEAPDAHGAGVAETRAGADAAQTFLRRVAATQPTSFSAVGEGECWRFVSDGLCGSALVSGGTVVHLSAFAE